MDKALLVHLLQFVGFFYHFSVHQLVNNGSIVGQELVFSVVCNQVKGYLHISLIKKQLTFLALFSQILLPVKSNSIGSGVAVNFSL